MQNIHDLTPRMDCKDCNESLQISSKQDQAKFVFLHGVSRGCKNYGYNRVFQNNPPDE